MIINKYFSSLRASHATMSKNFKKIFYLNLKHKFKKLPVLHRHVLMCCACSFLQSGALVCLANLGGLCLHSGGSRRPGVPSLTETHTPGERCLSRPPDCQELLLYITEHLQGGTTLLPQQIYLQSTNCLCSCLYHCKTMNASGSRTDPCETPEVTSCQSEKMRKFSFAFPKLFHLSSQQC